MSVNNIKKLTDNRFLNLYNVNITNDKTGKTYPYYIASRRDAESLACLTKDHSKSDAVMIVPVFSNNDIVLIKQYRPTIDDYIYEFPAGLVDPGESARIAVKRELFEEVGLECDSVQKMLDSAYTSVGMSDETCSVYMANVSGNISTANNQGHEDIEPIILKSKEIMKFLSENRVSIKTALLLRELYYRDLYLNVLLGR